MPCKIVYVGKEITLDDRDTREFRCPYPTKYGKEKRMIQDLLGMPSIRSPDVPPNHETGNTYKSYVYIDGMVEVSKNGLTVDIVDNKTNQKSTYENGKVTTHFKGNLVCKIVKDGYVSNGIVVGNEYAERRIFYTQSSKDSNGRTLITGEVLEATMNKICESVFGLCEKNLKRMFDNVERNSAKTGKSSSMEKTTETLTFRILILPDSVKNHNVTHEKPRGKPIGIDSFQNEYSEIPSSIHKTATYSTIDDMVYVLNPTSSSKTPRELVRYWGSHPVIGDQTFKKIGINLARDFYHLGGFMWYFGSHEIKFMRERHAKDDDTGNVGPYRGQFANGIWHQLYDGMKQARRAADPGKEMVMICAKKLGIARIEIVLSESVAVASLEKSLLVNGVPLDESGFQESDTYKAMEEVLLNAAKGSDTKPDWSVYMECVVDILGGRKMARERLVRHITSKFREHYTMEEWKLARNKKKAHGFLRKARFIVAALSSPQEGNTEMDAAEEYAHRMGMLVGIYAKFADVKNLAELGLQPGSWCDGHMLRRIFDDVAVRLCLSGGDIALNDVNAHVKRHMPGKEIDRKDIKRDLTLHFYTGLFKEMQG